ncbi:MAG: hypothetical protein H0U76_19345 [Ktedonobacteraceae bacterium]|nr:hypothetical protein [Ktedonobacteraceae bacterium]
MAARETVPQSYSVVIAEIEGRYYPLRIENRNEDGSISLGCSSHFYWEVEAGSGIPYALGPQHTRGIVSLKRYRDALDFCYRKQEGYSLWYQWEVLKARTELYPERNAWYRDEIVTMTGGRLPGGRLPQVEASGTYTVYGSVFLKGTHCFVSAPTIDDAWERLYECVCDHIAQKQIA